MSAITQNVLFNLYKSLESFSKVTDVRQLYASFDKIPHHRLHNLEAFLEELSENPCDSDFIPTFKQLSSNGYQYDPSNLITSSNVCFQTSDERASKNKVLKSKKTNTWILCPICDPFKNAKRAKENCERHDRMKKVTIGGISHEISINSPIHGFYATLNSSYVHHMAECHGVHGKQLVQDPIVGFTGPEMSLKVVCPYKQRNGEPCLAMTPYNYQNGNGFKAYYRHVEKHHFGNPTRLNVDRYSPEDIFIPLDFADCMEVTQCMALEWMNIECDEVSREAISRALQKVTNKSSNMEYFPLVTLGGKAEIVEEIQAELPVMPVEAPVMEQQLFVPQPESEQPEIQAIMMEEQANYGLDFSNSALDGFDSYLHTNAPNSLLVDQTSSPNFELNQAISALESFSNLSNEPERIYLQLALNPEQKKDEPQQTEQDLETARLNAELLDLLNWSNEPLSLE